MTINQSLGKDCLLFLRIRYVGGLYVKLSPHVAKPILVAIHVPKSPLVVFALN